MKKWKKAWNKVFLTLKNALGWFEKAKEVSDITEKTQSEYPVREKKETKKNKVFLKQKSSPPAQFRFHQYRVWKKLSKIFFRHIRDLKMANRKFFFNFFAVVAVFFQEIFSEKNHLKKNFHSVAFNLLDFPAQATRCLRYIGS